MTIVSYPHSYDSISNVSSGDVITASQSNLQIDAINAIESTLGIEPAGPFPTVADAIAAKLDANYGDDTGAANAYAVTLGSTLSAYEAGVMVVFKAANANSGASTLNVNSLGAASLKKDGTLSLEAGDIAADQIVQVVYDGSSFQLTNTLQISPTYAGQGSIDTVGTVTSGTWAATPLDIAHGGTGATTASDAFNALSPMTDVGDLIYGAASGQGYRLPRATSRRRSSFSRARERVAWQPPPAGVPSRPRICPRSTRSRTRQAAYRSTVNASRGWPIPQRKLTRRPPGQCRAAS